jgi:selenocysteine-specific elongation factor
VRPDLHYLREVLAELRTALCRHLDARGTVSAQEWKALSGLSRKYAIPLLEHFDAEKVTLRVGEVRRLRTPAGTRQAGPDGR